MSYSFKSCNIEDVVDLLDISRKPTQKAADSFDVCCPFCGKKSKYKMNVNTVKNVFHCFSCGRSGGVLDLYGQYRFGESYDSREVYQALSKELKGFTGESSCVNQQKADKYEEILPASDDVLDETYSALLSLPILALSDEDKKALLKRGLAEEEIGRIGFTSIPESFSDPEMEDLYTLLGAGKLKDETSALRYVKKTDLLLGLRIAKELLGMGKTLDHVPGFFKLCDTWCFKVAGSGTLIPARNMKHQVVGLQIRLKNKTKSGLRYMTVSSKGLDEGVSTAIARTHFSFGDQL